MASGLGTVEANMNPLAALFIILGVLLIIVGIRGSYKNLAKSFKAL
jgi:hypothetical protein